MTDKPTKTPEQPLAAQDLPPEIQEMIERYKYRMSLPEKTPTRYPKARDDEAIVAQGVLDEYVVYDLDRYKAHSLNPTAATVWQWCNGQTDADVLAERLAEHLDLTPEQAEPLLWLALDRLEGKKLLASKVDRPPAYTNITRRQVLSSVAVSLLPVVASLVVPEAAQAQSLPSGSPCTSTSQCAGECCCMVPAGTGGFCAGVAGQTTCFVQAMFCTRPLPNGCGGICV